MLNTQTLTCMKKKALLLFTGLLLSCILFAQQLPPGSCGIVCTYDASGNRLRRVYFCNNGIDPYPTRVQQEKTKATEEVQFVDALFPNPTTGKFFVTFSKDLKNARVILTDMNGKIMKQFVANGNKIDFDLSGVPNGMYIVQIEDNGLVITKKVIKQ
jgi:hypothetical protein